MTMLDSVQEAQEKDLGAGERMSQAHYPSMKAAKIVVKQQSPVYQAPEPLALNLFDTCWYSRGCDLLPFLV